MCGRRVNSGGSDDCVMWRGSGGGLYGGEGRECRTVVQREVKAV